MTHICQEPDRESFSGCKTAWLICLLDISSLYILKWVLPFSAVGFQLSLTFLLSVFSKEIGWQDEKSDLEPFTFVRSLIESFLAVTWKLNRWPCHSLTQWLTFVRSRIKRVFLDARSDISTLRFPMILTFIHFVFSIEFSISLMWVFKWVLFFSTVSFPKTTLLICPSDIPNHPVQFLATMYKIDSFLIFAKWQCLGFPFKCLVQMFSKKAKFFWLQDRSSEMLRYLKVLSQWILKIKKITPCNVSSASKLHVTWVTNNLRQPNCL